MPNLSKYLFSAVLPLLLLAAVSSGCGLADTRPRANPGDYKPEVLRADPGQAQWLEKQSMLYNSTELARVVSGSSIPWQLSPVNQGHSELFRHANVWLHVNPTTLVTQGRQSAFALLSRPVVWQALSKNNIRGLYVAPAFSSGAVWSGSYYMMDDYDDPVSYQFSEAAGTDKEYFALLDAANANQAILGLHLIPSATGIGPDFFLAARNMRHYPGLYCLVEVPENMWELLPEAKSEWDVQEITPEAAAQLGAAGLFAPTFTQEAQLGLPGGWAATGKVRGLDGQMRRFAYRYYESPRRAALNWGDPSAAGRRIVSGSIVRGVGELGAALVSVSFEPLYGLMPHAEPVAADAALEPGLGAASDVGQEVRRYGGWSWNRGDLSLPWLKAFLTRKQDFADDVLLTTGSGHALITGNAALLRIILDRTAAEGIELARMVHSLPGEDGLLYHNGFYEAREAYAELLDYPGVSNLLHKKSLFASGAALAAIALGLKPEENISSSQKSKIQQGHEALAFFLAAQPGLLVIPAHDIMGALPPGWIPDEVYSQEGEPGQPQSGGVSLLGERRRIQISERGVVALPTLYPGLDIQSETQNSFLNRLGQLAAMRDRTGVAGGRYLGRIKTSGRGAVILVTELPDNRGILLAATNFNRSRSSESVQLKEIPQAGSLKGAKLLDPFSGKMLGRAEDAIGFDLPGWGVKAVVIQPGGSNPLKMPGLQRPDNEEEK
ncbi:MAG: hypothetical protein IJD04_06030 [Desulfovibrionaceae bacterium]|nr:hypothetical protein [Desulfovibrionaceae bacterium]